MISDYKSAPFGLYSTTSAATPVNNDKGLATLVGSRFRGDDGKEFMLIQNGGTALPAGVVVQGPVAQVNAVGLSPATITTTGYLATLGPIAGVIGGQAIQIASGATAILANRFAGGTLIVVEGTGLGQTIPIVSNTAGGTTSAVGLVLANPFTTATDSTSRFTFNINPYGSFYGTDYTTDGAVISPTTLTGKVLGVTYCPIPASTATVPSYGYVQTKGVVAVLAGSTIALGLDVGVPTSTAGMIVTYAVATTTKIGTTLVASASGKYNLININL